jgi:hypothetical protein
MHGEKLVKLNELNFKRWKHKILFYMTTLNLVKFLLKKATKLSDNKFNSIIMVALDVWNQSDLCARTTS